MRNREYFDTYAGGGIVGGSKMDFCNTNEEANGNKTVRSGTIYTF